MFYRSIGSVRNSRCILKLTAFVFISYILYAILILNLSSIEEHESNCKVYLNQNYKHARQFDEPIDVVYTWVNGSDPKFQIAMNKYLKSVVNTKPEVKIDFDYDELKFSLRSLELYAPWIRHVYIVTNGQVPTWLNLGYKNVSIVTHEQIFLNKSNLPTFSKSAIETALHRIPGISKRFIYFNDNFFLGQSITIDDYITPEDEYVIYLSTTALNDCSEECTWSIIGNGYCDLDCNTFDCQYDGDDCINETGVENRKDFNSHNLKAFTSTEFVQRLYNTVYGFRKSYTAAYMPIMIDATIFDELQRKFPRQYAITESNRIKSEYGMDLGMSYYYYLLQEKIVLNISQIFDQYDLDDSSIWSLDEINRIPITESEKINFNEILLDVNFVNKEFVTSCSILTKLLIKNVGTSQKYKCKKYNNIHDGTYIYFSMESNEAEVKQHLDNIRMKPRKFMCLCDSLTSGNVKVNEQIKKYLFEFFTSLFPNPSKFELSTNN